MSQIYTDKACDRCSRDNAATIDLPMKKDENGDILFHQIDLCGRCIVKMLKHLFASKLPSKEKQPWLENFMNGIIR